MNKAFSKLHPAVNFIYFAFVITFSMFIMNPVCLLISLVCAFINAVYYNGVKAVKLSIFAILPMFLLIAIINPAFSHGGITVLTYLPSGNPLTLESIMYGLAAATMMSSVILWFSSFNAVITSDKIVYLFGKIIPSLSLVFSMALRFVPKFSAQFKEVRNAQKCIGRDISDGKPLIRLKNTVKIISIMITRSLENSIKTADSMKSRGYGLKGRTAFSIFRFNKYDFAVLSVTAILGTATSVFIFFGVFEFSYFPKLLGNIVSPISIISFFCYAALMILPMIINLEEDIKWKHLKSAI